MIIGGGEIYKRFLPIADTVYLTHVDAEVEGDTFFPTLEEKEWALQRSEHHDADERHAYAFTFRTYDRRQQR